MTVFASLIIWRWLHFTALFVLCGGAFFWLSMGSRVPERSRVRARRAAVLLLRVAAPVAALSGAGWLAGILANMTGGYDRLASGEVLRLFFFETQFGWITTLQLALCAAILLIGAWPHAGRRWLAMLLAVSALSLVSQAWLGHAAEAGATLLGAAVAIVYAVHVLAGAAWVGSLAPLLQVLQQVLLQVLLAGRRRDAGAERPGPNSQGEDGEAVFALMSRYSVMATVAVALIFASGIATAGIRVAGAFEKLLGSTYGEVLAVKVGLFAAMLLLAAFNRFIAMPELHADPLTAPQRARLRVLGLCVSITGELTLGILVLGAAAVLGITAPPP